MAKLYCCCSDPDCATLQSMVITLQVWGIDPTPKKEGRNLFFDASPDMAAWTKRRRDTFASVLRNWPTVH